MGHFDYFFTLVVHIYLCTSIYNQLTIDCVPNIYDDNNNNLLGGKKNSLFDFNRANSDMLRVVGDFQVQGKLMNGR